MRTTPTNWPRIAAMFVALAAPAVTTSEMIVLQDSSVLAGLIQSEDEQTLRLLAGDLAGRTETRIARGNVQQIRRDSDEQSQIDGCQDAPRLCEWAAAYFQAGLDDTAEICLRRALQLDPSFGAEPRRTGSICFCIFWNRTAFSLRTAALKDTDGPALLDAAVWARQAALYRQAAANLRRAHAAESASSKTAALAREWGVRLDPWIRLDLTPALDVPLLADPIPDEGLNVPARPDMVFITLPLHYEANARARTLTKDSFPGLDVQDWYGFRPLPTKAGRPDLSGANAAEPVYERLDWRLLPPVRSAPQRSSRREPSEGTGAKESTRQDGGASPPESDAVGRAELVGKNNVGPRKIDTTEITHVDPKTRVKSLPLTGWAALVVEVPKSARRLTIQWMDGVQEDVDLDFLRLATRPTTELLHADEGSAVGPAAPPPAVADLLTKVQSPFAATASLAVRRLARLAAEVGAGEETAWMSVVDQAVFAAAVDGDDEFRSAAWTYFVSRPSIPEPTAVFLAHRPACVQRDWIAIIKNALKTIPADSGSTGQPPTTRPAWNDAPAPVKTAVSLLGGLLRSNNASVCNEALDVLIGLGDQVDWSLTERSSETALSLLLARLDAITDRASVERVVRIAMKNVRPAMAANIAAQARRLNLRVSRPDDPLLTQWSPDAAADRQIALLTVLEAVPLGDSLYSRPFADLLAAAISDQADPAVREAAFRVLIRQVQQRREESRQARDLRTAASRPLDAPESGEFPVILLIKIDDPTIRGLEQAVNAGSEGSRREAITLLLQLGYAEETVRVLRQSISVPGDRVALLKALTESDPSAAYSDGLLAAFARMLRPDYASDGAFLISYLENALAESKRPDTARAIAAIRGGIDFAAANALIDEMGLSPARPLRTLLPKLCHMSPQDDQRYQQAWPDSAQRLQCLTRIDFRKGYLVDGRYEVWAILETLVSEACPPSDRPAAAGSEPRHCRWTTPERTTISLPAVTLESDESQKSYRVLWNRRQIGQGTVKTTEGLRTSSSYSRRLENPPEELLGRNGWGWPDPLNPIRLLAPAVGPAVLAEGTGAAPPAAGTMLLDATEYLRAALRSQHAFGAEDVDRLVPPAYQVVLRYGAFGSFYGVAHRPGLLPGGVQWRGAGPTEPAPVEVGRHCLLNVMLILERVE